MNTAAPAMRRCGRACASSRPRNSSLAPKAAKGSPVFAARRLILAHFWVAFAGFLLAILLGEWQMYVRSPLHAWVNNPEHYYRSVTAHGTVMAYVLPTLVAMGFGYAITEIALKRALIGLRWAWAGFGLVVAGTVIAAAPNAVWRGSVLFPFSPPMIASPFY